MNQFKKFVVLSVTILLASLLVNLQVANSATVRNGINCLKENAKVTIGKKVYICGKNPIVKSKRLTWTRVECLDDADVLNDAKDEYERWKDTLTNGGVEGQQTLKEMAGLISDLETSMKRTTCKRGI